MSHVFAELELSAAAFDEIAAKMRAAGYDHAFVDGAIDMHGVGVTRAESIAAAAPPAPEPPPVDREAATTTDGRPVDEVRAEQKAEGNVMHRSYIVLSEEERAKGFVRPVRKAYRQLTCGTVTTMGLAIAETYAREPSYYGSTMCVHCGKHYPVGESGEFVWIDGDCGKVGT